MPPDDSDGEKSLLELLSKNTNKQFVEVTQMLQTQISNNYARFEKTYRQQQMVIDRLEEDVRQNKLDLSTHINNVSDSLKEEIQIASNTVQ